MSLPIPPKSTHLTVPSELFGIEGIMSQEPQVSFSLSLVTRMCRLINQSISTRRRSIANRSIFNGPAENFFKFARWAFGPEGIPELRILAWGDFSHDGRWGESNVLLCRDQSLLATGSSFCALVDSDFEHWNLIDGNMDMLSACSLDHLPWTEL